ncbi:solute carrier family 25 member 44 [Bombus vancouverensis nearcticus]|uniref:Solute carrier family 25 member 44 n=2 Tax=Pyrobombus TaxID=144703 RepID=A0A6P8LX68_9HYME|nr:solute carrier family 25 member 44 [Bombus vancouverensis nearcticus]XP_033205821.1 solute carrier family 25 member 44 [Bombus vancouverensis nearcticus]XP_033205822.1 solute carrier family 25 member 44 [Bombus vancouverensis nearcticus]XP_033300046.1 solute carrier family 25 member 44 [Bombus bifarius]XP_033300047.1 solute carrier family 25 member 44 [Bombus bifarius]XP_033300048.1 solute carrier family 25 member 44 [Bombus bifarius]XP_050483240.1 solute carrier family 25 member 44 isofor
MSAVETPHFIRTIEWEMMDKTKFFPLSMLSSFSVRCCLYPLTVIKTRLQVQKHNNMYNGMLDACRKIYKVEGIGGLYRGFWISSIQTVSGVFYVSTYEGMRHILGQNNVIGNIDSRVKALIAGGAASLVGQTIVVPFDVLSQHLMVLGINYNKHGRYIDQMGINPLGLILEPGKSRTQISTDIIRLIYRRDGYRGFYRGYVASLCAYVPNSALWWGLYTSYQDELIKLFPEWVSHLFIQALAGTLGGFTTTIITNPLDIVRARLQVQRLDSMFNTFKVLWMEERLQMFTKGLSARLVQSACFSFSIILGYETIKRFSIIEEYKGYIRW